MGLLTSLTSLTSLLGGWYGYAAVGVAAAVASGFIVHAIDNGSYQELKAEQATQQAAAATAAVHQMQTWAREMHDAASGYTSSQNILINQIDAIQTELHNVQIRRPLPASCRPDAERLLNLQRAVRAANAAAAGGSVSPAVPATGGTD